MKVYKARKKNILFSCLFILFSIVVSSLYTIIAISAFLKLGVTRRSIFMMVMGSVLIAGTVWAFVIIYRMFFVEYYFEDEYFVVKRWGKIFKYRAHQISEVKLSESKLKFSIVNEKEFVVPIDFGNIDELASRLLAFSNSI